MGQIAVAMAAESNRMNLKYFNFSLAAPGLVSALSKG